MRRQKNIRRRGVLKGIFFIVGLVLFTAQLSGKFYLRASMPVTASPGEYSARQHEPGGQHAVSGNTNNTRLSLDKRYDLTTVFGLPAPIIRVLHSCAGVQRVLPLHADAPSVGILLFTLLRGPPSPTC